MARSRRNKPSYDNLKNIVALWPRSEALKIQETLEQSNFDIHELRKILAESPLSPPECKVDRTLSEICATFYLRKKELQDLPCHQLIIKDLLQLHRDYVNNAHTEMNQKDKTKLANIRLLILLSKQKPFYEKLVKLAQRTFVGTNFVDTIEGKMFLLVLNDALFYAKIAPSEELLLKYESILKSLQEAQQEVQTAKHTIHKNPEFLKVIDAMQNILDDVREHPLIEGQENRLLESRVAFEQVFVEFADKLKLKYKNKINEIGRLNNVFLELEKDAKKIHSTWLSIQRIEGVSDHLFILGDLLNEFEIKFHNLLKEKHNYWMHYLEKMKQEKGSNDMRDAADKLSLQLDDFFKEGVSHANFIANYKTITRQFDQLFDNYYKRQKKQLLRKN